MPSAKNFLSQQEQEIVLHAIQTAELNTSGEIRVHLANFCLGDEVKAAKKVFQKLRMHTTQERNGVLIYIATYSRKIAIVGDQGIHERLGADYWDKMVTEMIQKFRSNQKAQALADCIIDCGEKLKTYFPRAEDDKNELSNEISY
jgi:uncharacterized membrane protein